MSLIGEERRAEILEYEEDFPETTVSFPSRHSEISSLIRIHLTQARGRIE